MQAVKFPSELGLFPQPQRFLFALHPSPGRVLMRLVLGEAGGRSSVHRCWQVFPWRPDPGLAPLCPCLSALPRVGRWLIPLWGGLGGPACVWALPRPRPGDPESVSLGWQSFPLWNPWAGHVGLRESQCWLRGPGGRGR